MIKRFAVLFTLLVTAMTMAYPTIASAYNFGDMKSMTLVGKAWSALGQGDLEAVLAYTNKCIELYADKAKIMQEGLSDFPKGTNDEIHSFWALNDVATALFIQGEAFRKAGKTEEAQQAYQRVIDEFGFGQCWDINGWFWKPAEAAKEKLAALKSGANPSDAGGMTSADLVAKAWKALSSKNLQEVENYTNKTVELYQDKAKEMQNSLTEYAWESKEKIFSYWALNDVGTALFIKGEAYRNAGNMQEAKKAYRQLIDEFSYAQCWDPQGWFWKPAEAAAEKIDEIDASKS